MYIYSPSVRVRLNRSVPETVMLHSGLVIFFEFLSKVFTLLSRVRMTIDSMLY